MRVNTNKAKILPSNHKNALKNANIENKPLQIQMSIDEKHTILMNEFGTMENITIPQLIAKKNILLLRKEALTVHELDEYLTIKDSVASIELEIAKLEQQKNAYLLKNAVHIFDYFQLKKNISSGTANQNGIKAKSVNAFFKIANESKSEDIALNQIRATNQNYQNEILTPHESQSRYWANVNGYITDEKGNFSASRDLCGSCNLGELVQLEEEGTFTCRLCGVTAQLVVDFEKPSYKEPPGEVSYTAYVRLNHFKEILSQFQAKETTQIPAEVMDAICRRIKKERITDPSEITYARTREILRKLGYNKYFEHVQYINCKFGIKPPIMPEALIEVLCVLFVEIQTPWAKHCPSSRQNFFGYNFVLCQLLSLLNATEYCKFIPMLKDQTKSNDQDQIWRLVCKDLGWLFIPSPR